MNNKKLAEYQDYNPNDIGSQGADWTLYADGRISADTHSRWQGSVDGERWIIEGEIDPAAIGADGEDDDAVACLVSWVERFVELGDYEGAGMRKIRPGYRVQ